MGGICGAPSDGRADGNKCLIGHQVRYTRRRRAAQCFNGQQYERAEFRKNCPCAEEDYEAVALEGMQVAH